MTRLLDENSRIFNLAGEDCSAFIGGEFFPFSDREVAKRKGSNPFAEKTETGMSDCGGHAADLAIFAFTEFQADPGVDDVFAIADRRITIGNGGSLLKGSGPTREAFVAFDDDGSASEFLEGGRLGLSFHEDEIATAMLKAGIQQAILQGFLVGEEKQAFRVHVESS